MVPEAKEVLGKKRDGGRPPKVVVVDGMKCGRGRPLKEVVVDGKKCGRGRPPKVVVVDGKKRGRDRPPKVMHGKKRGRGRPPSRRQLIYRPLSMSALELTSNKRCSFYKIIMPSSRHENMLVPSSLLNSISNPKPHYSLFLSDSEIFGLGGVN